MVNSAVKQKADGLLKQGYSDYYILLIKYCKVRMGEARASAADCVQEAFIVYYNKLLKGEDIKNPKAFLYRTADNFLKKSVADYQKTLQNASTLDEVELQTDFDFTLCDKDSIDYDECLRALLDSLKSDELKLYEMKYMEKKSLNEISEILNISQAAAAKRTSRLRTSIKEKLTEVIKNNTEGGAEFE